MRCSIVLSLLLTILNGGRLQCEAGPATEHPAAYTQPDGTITPELFLRGDERYAWLSDSNGYTVIRDEDGWFVYAQSNSNRTLLDSTGVLVGERDPQSLGLEPHLVHSSAFEDHGADDYIIEDLLRMRRGRQLAAKPRAILCKHEGTLVEPCYLKQLALLVRFADHVDRQLPDPEDIDVLFNHNGPTGHRVASTGSIADAYRANSFGTFVMDTHVSDWFTISKTERYCSEDKNGFNYKQTRECWAEALELYAATLGDNGLLDFDSNKDGFLDGLAIVHSGVGAEMNGEDCETGATYTHRIWSHAVPQSPTFEFLSQNDKHLGIKVGRFYVFSGIRGTCPRDGSGQPWFAGHIAVGVHEGGHFLGLPDLYGAPGKDQGIGNWGFMGSMYGWASSPRYPGLMSGYCRHLLNWVKVVDVTYTQEITVTSACDSNVIYRIKHNMASDYDGDEYFLIENRQPCGHDVKLKTGGEHREGIVIWHVDHTGILGRNSAGRYNIRFNTARPPTHAEWPAVHSRASVLQGDGNFDLENNVNKGDQFDSFHVEPGSYNVAYKISNSGVTMNNGDTKPYPNTKSIARGEQKTTGITIEVLDSPKNDMRVMVTLDGSSAPRTTLPAPVPELEPEPESDPESEAVTTQDSSTSSVTNVGGSKSNSSTPPPPTPSPVSAPTDPPIDPLYDCDNKPFDRFIYQEEGSSRTEIRQCQFINAEKNRPPEEWCNRVDPTKKAPLYEICSRECFYVTNCPPPEGYQPVQESSIEKTEVSLPERVAPTDAPLPAPTDAPIPRPTDVPVPRPTYPPQSCDNKPTDRFSFSQEGSNRTEIRQCQIINAERNNPPEEWCNKVDPMKRIPIHEICPQQCTYITGCTPNPSRNLRHSQSKK